MSKNSLSRRQLLKALGSLPATVPIVQLTSILLDGFLQKAMAQAPTGSRYVYFGTEGAPPRWMFDLLLTPYDTTAYTPSAAVGTVGVDSGSGRYTGIRYATTALTVNGKVINVPPLWNAMVPGPGGTSVRLSGLLENFLSIRGVNVGIDGHSQSEALGFKPAGAQHTLMGLVGDQSGGCPIRALRTGFGSFKFSSATGITPTVVTASGATTVTNLLAPFTPAASAAFIANRNRVKPQIAAAVAALDAFAESQHPGAAYLKNSRSDAEQMMAKAASELKPLWDQLYAKYEDIAKRAMLVQVPGLTDKPYGAATRPAAGTPTQLYYQFGDKVFHNTPLDVRDSITATTYPNSMADNFALAELALLKDLSNSMALSLGGLRNLNVNGATEGLTHDQHFIGGIVGTYLNTKFFAAYGACLLQLVTQLKAANLFDQTVIHVGAEFNRAAKNSGGGSDHGWQAASATILSGKVNGPLVIGNVVRDSLSTNHRGSWGYSAPSVDGRMLDYGDVANALAKLLGVPKVVNRAAAEDIITLSSGKVVSLIGQGRQV